MRYLCVGSTNPHALIFLNAPGEEFQKLIRQRFTDCYLHKNKASTLFNNHITSSDFFSLMEVPVSLSRAEYDIFTSTDCEVVFKKCPVDHAYKRLNETLGVGEALLLCNYIEPLIARIRQLEAELHNGTEAWCGTFTPAKPVKTSMPRSR